MGGIGVLGNDCQRTNLALIVQGDNWKNFSLTFPPLCKPEIMLPISHINKTGNIHETKYKRPCMYPFIHLLMTSIKDIIVSATVLDGRNL